MIPSEIEKYAKQTLSRFLLESITIVVAILAFIFITLFIIL